MTDEQEVVKTPEQRAQERGINRALQANVAVLIPLVQGYMATHSIEDIDEATKLFLGSVFPEGEEEKPKKKVAKSGKAAKA